MYLKLKVILRNMSITERMFMDNEEANIKVEKVGEMQVGRRCP